MKNDKLTLRVKITLIFTVVSTIMCIVLTLFVFRSADKLVDAIPTSPAIHSSEIADDISGLPAQQGTPATHLLEANRVFRSETLYVMIGIILLGSGIIFCFTGRKLKPLETLTDKVSNQSIDDLSKEIPLSNSQDELYKLTKAFNQRNKQIFDAYYIQKNFSANAAHELCTPLAVMQTKLDVFSLNPKRSTEEYKILIDYIEENCQRLSAIVQSLLKLTNSSDVDLNQRILLKEIIDETIFELEDSLEERNITVKLSGENIIVNGNDTLLKQAVYNLINNAIKYNNEGGTITIVLKENAKTVEISVSDTGIGIPDECKAHLFEPFYRVDKSRSREIGGSGLGLSIVDKIIEMHKGEIKVTDNIPQGTMFTVTFNK